jgi:hypothetical protein
MAEHTLPHSQASSSAESLDPERAHYARAEGEGVPETFPLADAKAEAAAAVKAERRALHRRLAGATQAPEAARRDHDHDVQIQNHRLAQDLQQIKHLNDKLRSVREAAVGSATSYHRHAQPEQNGNHCLARSLS